MQIQSAFVGVAAWSKSCTTKQNKIFRGCIEIEFLLWFVW